MNNEYANQPRNRDQWELVVLVTWLVVSVCCIFVAAILSWWFPLGIWIGNTTIAVILILRALRRRNDV